MAAGLAEKVYRKHPDLGPVVICDGGGAPRWHPLWMDNPAICAPSDVTAHLRRITFGHGHLPYYQPDYASGMNKAGRDWRARDHRPSIYFSKDELARGETVRACYGSSFILVEPTGTDRKNRNRCWPKPYWQALVELLKAQGYTVAQLDRPAADRLSGVSLIPHSSFRDALSILRVATMSVLIEGGLAHGAGALRAPAVVLWGGCSDVETMAYPDHVNIADDGPGTPCGSLLPCDHCWEAWLKITPERVFSAVQAALGCEVAA